MKKARLFRGLAAIVIFIECLFLGLTITLFQYAPYINIALNIQTSKLVLQEGLEDTNGDGKIDDNDVDKPQYFKSDYAEDVNNITDEEKAKKNADVAAFVETEEEEGAVLLKNNGALPLKANEIKDVQLFGRSTVIPYQKSNSGGGSGGTNVKYLDALKEKGFTYNETLVEAYNSDTTPSRSGSNRTIGESPASVYTADVKASFKNGSVAIVMLSREAGESNDMYTGLASDMVRPDGAVGSELALDQNEKDMLALVKQYKDNGTFTKVIVLLNTSNPLEVNWFDTYGVDAAMWIGGPGQSTGFRGVPDLLKGEANPSGRLVDTYATNSLSAPATVNFGQFVYKNRSEVTAGLADNASEGLYYVVQEEGIYVGYKYYETRYEDCILNRYGADSDVGIWESKGGKWNYADEVSYPFGYGLSYTTFTKTLDGVKYNADEDVYEVTVTVKNTGSVKGKDVVEVYAQTPYGEYEKTNKVEKAAVQLVGFEKTKEIEPNATETVTVKVQRYFLAAYDYTKAKTYILSEGEYFLSVGDNAHDALNNILAAKGASGMTDFDGNAVNGNKDNVYTWSESKLDTETYSIPVTDQTSTTKVTNRLDKSDINYYVPGTATYLSRQDWKNTYPTSAVEVTANQKLIETLCDDGYKKPDNAPSALNVATGIDKGIKLADMYGVPYDDPLWTDFINQLTVSELIKSCMDSGGISEKESIAAPQTSNGDGPDGIAGNAYVNQSVAASTWSKEMLAKRGYFMGEDAIMNHSAQQVWCPGVDTHRTPFGGRNFEYYSEDANLAYMLGAEQTKVMESKGVSVGPKHFFANDQESWRTGISTYGNEQGFREIQLRAFEGHFTKGGATSVMTSFNRIGPIWIGHYSEAQDGILRGEWGFIGIVITDAAGVNSYMHSVGAIMGGTDMFCYTAGVAADGRTKEINTAIRNNDDGYIVEQLKEINHRIYYTYAHTNVMNGLASAYDVVSVTPWWQPTIIVVNVVFALGAVALGSLFAVFAYRKKKEEN